MKKLHRSYVSAVIVAGGRGSRMQMDINKQYIEVAGIPVLARTLQVFQHSEWVNEIVLVVNVQDILYCKQAIIDAYKFTKVKAIVAGGDERQKSVFNGLKNVSAETELVMIHDGARPFVKEETLQECIGAAMEFKGSAAAVPVKDTIKVADARGFVVGTPDRNTLWAIQTPQAFDCRLIRKAHEKAEEEGFLGTDDAVLMERMGYKLKLVMASYENIKITTKEDLIVAEAIVASRE